MRGHSPSPHLSLRLAPFTLVLAPTKKNIQNPIPMLWMHLWVRGGLYWDVLWTLRVVERACTWASAFPLRCSAQVVKLMCIAGFITQSETHPSEWRRHEPLLEAQTHNPLSEINRSGTACLCHTLLFLVEPYLEINQQPNWRSASLRVWFYYKSMQE